LPLLATLAALDARGLRLARTAGHDPRAERAVAAFTKVGEHAACWLVLGAAGAVVDRRRSARWRRTTGVVAGAYALNTAVKLVVRRRRPALDGLPPLVGTPTGLSFPSAHSTSSFAAADAFSRLGLPPAPLYALAAALAFSRLYLGVHYPSDIAAGAVLGTVLSRAAA
jgi:undecaprenyl-diphosphatase